MARHRIADKQAGALPLTLSPISGTLPPYSKTPVTLSFAPKVGDRPLPFAAQIDPEKLHVQHNFRVNLTFSPFSNVAKVNVKARAVFPGIDVTPVDLCFGDVGTGGSQEKLAYVKNRSELPVQFTVARGVMYFSVEPGSAHVPAGADVMLKVRYTPRGMGRHKGDVEINVVDE